MHPRNGARSFRRARNAWASGRLGGAIDRLAPPAVVYTIFALIVLLCAGPGIYLVATQLRGPLSGSPPEPAPTASAYSSPTAHAYSDPAVKLQAVGTFDINTLDPPNATDASSNELASMIFPSLLTLDQNANVIPWAAAAMPTVSIDGLTFTFQVRPGLKWSDGTAITATTFAFALNRALNPCNAFGSARLLYMIKDAAKFNHEPCDAPTGAVMGSLPTLIDDSITAPDPLTLVVQLTAPATYFLDVMTLPPTYAVPAQLITRYGARYVEHLTDRGGFGGDMFQVTHWTLYGQVRQVRFERNDTFWGTPPNIREVDITFYKDATTAYTAYLLEGMDDVGSAPIEQLASASKHAGFHQVPASQIDYYAMNWKMAPFNDIRMRQAFALALDKATLAKDTWHGAVLPTNHIVPIGIPGYNYRALLGLDYSTSVNGDAQRANSLATAYAIDTGCGAATDFSKCPPVALSIRSDSPDAANEAAAAQQMWLTAMPQYPITITMMDATTLQRKATAHQLQFWASSRSADYPDPHEWLTANLSCGASDNAGQACDQQADSLLLAADVTPEQSPRMEEYQQAEQMLVTDVAWLPLDQTTLWWEARPWIQNFSIASDGLIPKETWQTMRNRHQPAVP